MKLLKLFHLLLALLSLPTFNDAIKGIEKRDRAYSPQAPRRPESPALPDSPSAPDPTNAPGHPMSMSSAEGSVKPAYPGGIGNAVQRTINSSPYDRRQYFPKNAVSGNVITHKQETTARRSPEATARISPEATARRSPEATARISPEATARRSPQVVTTSQSALRASSLDGQALTSMDLRSTAPRFHGVIKTVLEHRQGQQMQQQQQQKQKQLLQQQQRYLIKQEQRQREKHVQLAIGRPGSANSVKTLPKQTSPARTFTPATPGLQKSDSNKALPLQDISMRRSPGLVARDLNIPLLTQGSNNRQPPLTYPKTVLKSIRNSRMNFQTPSRAFSAEVSNDIEGPAREFVRPFVQKVPNHPKKYFTPRLSNSMVPKDSKSDLLKSGSNSIYREVAKNSFLSTHSESVLSNDEKRILPDSQRRNVGSIATKNFKTLLYEPNGNRIASNSVAFVHANTIPSSGPVISPEVNINQPRLPLRRTTTTTNNNNNEKMIKDNFNLYIDRPMENRAHAQTQRKTIMSNAPIQNHYMIQTKHSQKNVALQKNKIQKSPDSLQTLWVAPDKHAKGPSMQHLDPNRNYFISAANQAIRMPFRGNMGDAVQVKSNVNTDFRTSISKVKIHPVVPAEKKLNVAKQQFINKRIFPSISNPGATLPPKTAAINGFFKPVLSQFTNKEAIIRRQNGNVVQRTQGNVFPHTTNAGSLMASLTTKYNIKDMRVVNGNAVRRTTSEKIINSKSKNQDPVGQSLTGIAIPRTTYMDTSFRPGDAVAKTTNGFVTPRTTNGYVVLGISNGNAVRRTTNVLRATLNVKVPLVTPNIDGVVATKRTKTTSLLINKIPPSGQPRFYKMNQPNAENILTKDKKAQFLRNQTGRKPTRDQNKNATARKARAGKMVSEKPAFQQANKIKNQQQTSVKKPRQRSQPPVSLHPSATTLLSSSKHSHPPSNPSPTSIIPLPHNSLHYHKEFPISQTTPVESEESSLTSTFTHGLRETLPSSKFTETTLDEKWKNKELVRSKNIFKEYPAPDDERFMSKLEQGRYGYLLKGTGERNREQGTGERIREQGTGKRNREQGTGALSLGNERRMSVEDKKNISDAVYDQSNEGESVGGGLLDEKDSQGNANVEENQVEAGIDMVGIQPDNDDALTNRNVDIDRSQDIMDHSNSPNQENISTMSPKQENISSDSPTLKQFKDVMTNFTKFVLSGNSSSPLQNFIVNTKDKHLENQLSDNQQQVSASSRRLVNSSSIYTAGEPEEFVSMSNSGGNSANIVPLHIQNTTDKSLHLTNEEEEELERISSSHPFDSSNPSKIINDAYNDAMERSRVGFTNTTDNANGEYPVEVEGKENIGEGVSDVYGSYPSDISSVPLKSIDGVSDVVSENTLNNVDVSDNTEDLPVHASQQASYEASPEDEVALHLQHATSSPEQFQPHHSSSIRNASFDGVLPSSYTHEIGMSSPGSYHSPSMTNATADDEFPSPAYDISMSAPLSYRSPPKLNVSTDATFSASTHEIRMAAPDSSEIDHAMRHNEEITLLDARQHMHKYHEYDPVNTASSSSEMDNTNNEQGHPAPLDKDSKPPSLSDQSLSYDDMSTPFGSSLESSYSDGSFPSYSGGNNTSETEFYDKEHEIQNPNDASISKESNDQKSSRFNNAKMNFEHFESKGAEETSKNGSQGNNTKENLKPQVKETETETNYSTNYRNESANRKLHRGFEKLIGKDENEAISEKPSWSANLLNHWFSWYTNNTKNKHQPLNNNTKNSTSNDFKNTNISDFQLASNTTRASDLSINDNSTNISDVSKTHYHHVLEMQNKDNENLSTVTPLPQTRKKFDNKEKDTNKESPTHSDGIKSNDHLHPQNTSQRIRNMSKIEVDTPLQHELKHEQESGSESTSKNDTVDKQHILEGSIDVDTPLPHKLGELSSKSVGTISVDAPIAHKIGDASASHVSAIIVDSPVAHKLGDASASHVGEISVDSPVAHKLGDASANHVGLVSVDSPVIHKLGEMSTNHVGAISVDSPLAHIANDEPKNSGRREPDLNHDHVTNKDSHHLSLSETNRELNNITTVNTTNTRQFQDTNVLKNQVNESVADKTYHEKRVPSSDSLNRTNTKTYNIIDSETRGALTPTETSQSSAHSEPAVSVALGNVGITVRNITKYDVGEHPPEVQNQEGSFVRHVNNFDDEEKTSGTGKYKYVDIYKHRDNTSSPLYSAMREGNVTEYVEAKSKNCNLKKDGTKGEKNDNKSDDDDEDDKDDNCNNDSTKYVGYDEQKENKVGNVIYLDTNSTNFTESKQKENDNYNPNNVMYLDPEDRLQPKNTTPNVMTSLSDTDTSGNWSSTKYYYVGKYSDCKEHCGHGICDSFESRDEGGEGLCVCVPLRVYHMGSACGNNNSHHILRQILQQPKFKDEPGLAYLVHIISMYGGFFPPDDDGLGSRQDTYLTKHLTSFLELVTGRSGTGQLSTLQQVSCRRQLQSFSLDTRELLAGSRDSNKRDVYQEVFELIKLRLQGIGLGSEKFHQQWYDVLHCQILNQDSLSLSEEEETD